MSISHIHLLRSRFPLNINTEVLFSSTIALAGGNFCVVASDTRMTQHDVNVMARDVDKVHPL